MAVQRLAPDEMPLFDDTTRAWRRLRGRRRRSADDMLGFGVGELQPVITTAALAAAYAASGFVARTAIDAARDETSTVIRSRTRRLIRALIARPVRRRPVPAPEPASTPEGGLQAADLRRVRQAALSVLRASGLPAQQSELLADAVVGALVTGADR